jgi:undecaprenyl-diphosphatase
MVHTGTLLAILIYFQKQLTDLLKGILQKQKSSLQLARNLIISTLPIVVIGLTLENQINSIFSTPSMVAIAMFTTGAFFIMGEWLSKKYPSQSTFTALKALIVGLIQSIAIVPGVSRSGSTLTAGLLTGLDREKAAEYSFLIAIPAISGATVLSVLKIILEPSSTQIHYLPLLAGFITSFISGYFSIKFLMHLYKKHSLKPFALYLFIVSACILIFQ